MRDFAFLLSSFSLASGCVAHRTREHRSHEHEARQQGDYWGSFHHHLILPTVFAALNQVEQRDSYPSSFNRLTPPRAGSHNLSALHLARGMPDLTFWS